MAGAENLTSRGRRAQGTASRTLSALAAAALLATLLTALAPPASAGLISKTLYQFSGGLNDTTISFGSCIASNSTTSFTLPWNANVSSASMDVYWTNYSNASNATGWVRSNVGNDGSVEENVTFAYSAYMNLTATGFNRYLGNANATSGNVSVPLLLESCPPAGGWDLDFYGVSIAYTQNIPSNTSKPVFSGPILNQTHKVNTSAYSNVYLPTYFSDADGDDLNYTVVKQNSSGAGWSNLTVSIANSWVYFASSNGWLGNLTFRVDGTDPANQTASSNNITLEVVANQAPVLSYNLTDESILVNTSAYLWYLPSYFYDPDASSSNASNGSNATLTYAFLKTNTSDPGWSNVSLSLSYGQVYAQSSSGWVGNLTFAVKATDDGGLSATSNLVTLTIRENGPPELVGNVSDVEMEMNTEAYLWTWGVFSEPDREPMTYTVVKSDPNATGWSYLSIGGGGNNSSGYFVISHSGKWAGNVSLRLQASDPGGRTALSNEFKIYVRGWPEWFATILAQTVWRGTVNRSAVDFTQVVRDIDGDLLNYTVWPSGTGPAAGGGGPPVNNSTNRTLAYNPIYFVVNGSYLDIGSSDAAWTGSATYYVAACDPTSRCAYSNDFRVSVIVPPNHPPAFTGPIPDLYVVQDTTRYGVVNLAGYFRDPDRDPLVFGIQRVNGLDPAWNFTSVVLNGTRVDLRSMDPSWTGNLSVLFFARDPYLEAAYSNEVIVHVVFQDRPPVFSGPIASLTMVAGTALQGALDAALYFSDPDSLPLDFSVVNASTSDGWLWLDFSFNGSRLDIQSRDDEGWTGQVCFALRATDVMATTADSNVMCLTVTAPPNVPPSQVQPLPDLTVAAGADAPDVLNLSTYFTDDRYIRQVTYAILKGAEPGWTTVDLFATGTSLSVAFLGPTPPADLSYRVLVTDLRGATLTTAPATLHITARPGNLAPTIEGPASIFIAASGTKLVKLTASDPNGDTLRFTVDGMVAGLTASVDPATFVLTVAHASPDENLTAVLKVTVDDGWGLRAVYTVQVAVFDPANAPRLTVTLQADRLGGLWVNGTVAVWSEPPGAAALDVEILVDLARQFSAPVLDGAFHFQLPDALGPGDHSVRVNATDGFGRSGSASGHVVVAVPPPPLPELTAIGVNGAVAHEVEALVPLTFSLSAAAPLGAEITVTWLLDGEIVGVSRTIDLTLSPGHHTVTARVSNGIETKSIDLALVATPVGPPGPGAGGADFGFLILAGAAAAGAAVVAGAVYIGRKRR